MSKKELKKICGRVVLVGAGPGDLGLITVAGLRRLEQAQVVVYDALVNPELLDHVHKDAELIDVGKRAGAHKYSQEQINQLLARKAAEGKLVVRLKGGDPYLFGRGGEEAIYLGRHGIALEVISGVTSGIAAAATAGVPVTYRHIARTVTLVTGHEDLADNDSSVDYAALARLISDGGTVCFYMAMTRLSEVCSMLHGAGLSLDIPAVVIEWGTCPRQRTARASLGNLPEKVQQENLQAPSIVVVGQVAALDEPGLDFFSARPLFGKRIMITRSPQQSLALKNMLYELGAEVIEAPAITIRPKHDWADVDRVIRKINQYDWLVFTSVNGVKAFARRLADVGADSRRLANLKVAVIGDATARSLRKELALIADCVPGRFVAESLADAMTGNFDMSGKRVLMLRAEIARPALAVKLKEAGAVVDDMAIYSTQLANAVPACALERLRNHEVDWVTFTSSSTVLGLLNALGTERSLLEYTRIASIGPITSRTVHDAALRVTAEANVCNMQGLVDAIVDSA